MKKIEVAVLCENANGAPEFSFHCLEVTQGQYDEGQHYELAMADARDAGYEPKAAFDDQDPAWLLVKEHRQYKAFFNRAVDALKGGFIGDSPVSGADMVDHVAELFTKTLEDPAIVIFCAASAEGFWSNADGWVGRIENAFFTVDPQAFKDLSGTDIVVLGMNGQQIDGISDVPDFDDLWHAAADAAERGRKFGFSIGPDNAVEVMREELSLGGHSLPAFMDPVLACLAVAGAEAERLAPRMHP